MTLRDWFAGQESLVEWDTPDAVPAKALCEALAGRPQPATGWYCTGDDMLDMLRWEAQWRAALKYIRADAMIVARELPTH